MMGWESRGNCDALACNLRDQRIRHVGLYIIDSFWFDKCDTLLGN